MVSRPRPACHFVAKLLHRVRVKQRPPPVNRRRREYLFPSLSGKNVANAHRRQLLRRARRPRRRGHVGRQPLPDSSASAVVVPSSRYFAEMNSPRLGLVGLPVLRDADDRDVDVSRPVQLRRWGSGQRFCSVPPTPPPRSSGWGSAWRWERDTPLAVVIIRQLPRT